MEDVKETMDRVILSCIWDFAKHIITKAAYEIDENQLNILAQALAIKTAEFLAIHEISPAVPYLPNWHNIAKPENVTLQ